MFEAHSGFRFLIPNGMLITSIYFELTLQLWIDKVTIPIYLNQNIYVRLSMFVQANTRQATDVCQKIYTE